MGPCVGVPDGLGARVTSVGLRGAQCGGMALPVLGSADGWAAGRGEIHPCEGRGTCGSEQPGLVYDLALTQGSFLEVTTVDRAGIADGSALLVVESMYALRRASCALLGALWWSVISGSGMGVVPGHQFAGDSRGSIEDGRFGTSGVELIRRAIFSSFRTTQFFYVVAFRSILGRFLACQQSVFFEKCVHLKWSKSLELYVLMDICAFTHEHPRTRRCTIHPCTLTPTLTTTQQNHVNSVHIWISLETVCIFFRASVDALY